MKVTKKKLGKKQEDLLDEFTYSKVDGSQRTTQEEGSNSFNWPPSLFYLCSICPYEFYNEPKPLPPPSLAPSTQIYLAIMTKV